MRIYIHLGEPLWRTAGVKELSLELAAPATVSSALAALEARLPALWSDLEEGEIPPTVFLGEEIATPETPLTDGDRLLLVWALAGG